jgi:hypothetical protein
MLRLLKTAPTKLFNSLSIAAIVLTIGQPAFAATTKVRPIAARPPAQRDNPICYAELSGQPSRLNLDRLCGVGLKSNTIDLSIDTNGDGIPDQLLAEMKKFRATIAKANSSEVYETAFRQLESRLPYSNQVKQLQAQQRQLQKQLENSKGGAASEQTYRQLSALQEQIYKDPSYTKVQEAMSKVYRKIDR